QEKVNGELIGNLGNLVNRTLSFVNRYYEGNIPGTPLPGGPVGGPLGNPARTEFWDGVRRFEADITGKLERAELRDAFRAIFALSGLANKRFQDGEPWKKRQEDPAAAGALIADLCQVVRDIAILIEPFLPAAAEKIAGFFGKTLDRTLPGHLDWTGLGATGGLDRVVRSEVLFTRLEDDFIAALRERYSGSQKEREEARELPSGLPAGLPPGDSPPVDPAARFLATLDLRVARIVKIERHPQADKLYIETLEIAGEERIIVSGLAPFYTEAELLNKKIILAYNLKPAKLRGVLSQGMLLAGSLKAGDGPEIVEVLDAGEAPTGTRVLIEGAAGASAVPAGAAPAQISIDQFLAVPLEIKDHTVLSGGQALSLLGKPIRCSRIAEGGVH
ncbi:MAG: methionine--tRNA ligase, partial [Treponema sp.]|nr:methionine--tRNA ligase [Treponema sp.]